jgi:hypothetical protein
VIANPEIKSNMEAMQKHMRSMMDSMQGMLHNMERIQKTQQGPRKWSRSNYARRWRRKSACCLIQVCQFFCVNGPVLFLGMGARGKGQRPFPRPAM